MSQDRQDELSLEARQLPTGMWEDGGIYFFTEGEALNAKPARPGSEGDPAALRWAPESDGSADGPQLVAQNVDSIYLSVYTDIEVAKSERLVALRDVARGRRDGDPVYVWATDLRTGLGRTWQVTYSRPPYALRLELPEVASINIARRPWAQSPQCYVEIRAAALWQYGAAVIIPEIIAVLSGWQAPGEAPPRVEVSRIDMAADFMDLGLDGSELFAGRWVTRARHRATEAASSTESKAQKAARKAKERKKALADRGTKVIYRGTHYAGTTFGKGDLVCSIYDKTREISDRGGSKKWMHRIWEAGGWDGVSAVWRVEMRLRKDALKSLVATARELTTLCDEADEVPPEWAREWAGGCVTVGNSLTAVMRAMPGMWRYMTEEWLTLRDVDPTDKRRSRWPINDDWQAVQAVSWSGVVGHGDAEVNRVRKQPRAGDKTGSGQAKPAAFQLCLDGGEDAIAEIQRPEAIFAFGDGILREATAEGLRLHAGTMGIRLDVQSAEARRDLLLPGLLGTLAAWDAAASVADREFEDEDDDDAEEVGEPVELPAAFVEAWHELPRSKRVAWLQRNGFPKFELNKDGEGHEERTILRHALLRLGDVLDGQDTEYTKRRRRARQKSSYQGAVRLRMSLVHHPGRGTDNPQSWRSSSSTPPVGDDE